MTKKCLSVIDLLNDIENKKILTASQFGNRVPLNSFTLLKHFYFLILCLDFKSNF